MQQVLTADYVVIGAGATTMAFVDTLLSETDASVIIVDRHHRPGGHWNDAYPFVRLHSPACFYGVNSAPLGQNRVDQTGLNRGNLELASAAEIVAYFDDVMRHRFLPSGRVTFLPRHDYADGVATSLLTGETLRLIARKKLVDGTYAQTETPATHPPRFDLVAGVRCIPPGDLVRLDHAPSEFGIIGGGKTAIDAVLYLLENGTNPDRILWVRPRDAWLINRRNLQPLPDFAEPCIGGSVAEMEAARDATSVEDLFLRLEATGEMFRIDPNVTPSMYHCATVSGLELAELRRVKRVVRQGRVRRIEPGKLVLDHGDIATAAGAIHVNCTSRGVPARGADPIFQPAKIVLQFVHSCWPCFSGALIGWLEANRPDDATRNHLAQPVPMVEVPLDWLCSKLLEERTTSAWESEPDLLAWKEAARVERFSSLWSWAETSGNPTLAALIDRFMAAYGPALKRIGTLYRDAGGGSDNHSPCPGFGIDRRKIGGFHVRH